jgi:hypothetical protein
VKLYFTSPYPLLKEREKLGASALFAFKRLIMDEKEVRMKNN